jgi:hypothetical protein
MYNRDCDKQNFYYESIQVKVNTSGYYSFLSYSTMDTYGIIYKNTFNPLNPAENLIQEEDDGGSNFQFRLNIRLSGDMTYVLVITTYLPKQTSEFAIVALGTNKVVLERNSKYIYVCIESMTHAPQRHLLPTDTCSPNSCSPWTIAPLTVARQEHLLPWQSFLQLLIKTSNNKTPITQVLNSDKTLHLTSIGIRPHPHLPFALTHTWISPSPTLGLRPHPHLRFALTHTWTSPSPTLGLRPHPHLHPHPYPHC